MKPAVVVTVFVICLVAVLVAMAWSSAIVLRLERAEQQARAQATREEDARLALWRMDSALTSLLAEENARPYFHYGAFYAAGGAYTRMFAESQGGGALVPSPLLRETPDPVLLHFQIAPGGALTSPQVPGGALRTRALAERHTTAARLAEHERRLRELRPLVSSADLLARLPREEPRQPTPPPKIVSAEGPEAQAAQKWKSAKEFQARQQTLQSNTLRLTEEAKHPAEEAGSEVQEGAMTPVWTGGALLLARRVRVNGGLYVQGCWLAWPRLQLELMASVQDLLPGARLDRVEGAGPADDERRLAALPVRLVMGNVPEAEPSPLSPVRLSLVGAWVCALLAALSVAALLGGVLALSERRRIFVSAVTHELRTPLTTFRLYTDMLAEGMVATEEKRREYLDRLRGEGERLSHLVENVLFYSRIESGRVGVVREKVDLAQALAPMLARLSERASKAGLRVAFAREGEDPVPVNLDASALEQVLVNLVDNACRYAADAEPPLIHIELGREAGRAVLRVRDHGPGLSRAERRRLFRPFSRSDREAAAGGPGVGLGLALSRRLMRAQNGDLALDRAVTSGAAFVVTLPLAS